MGIGTSLAIRVRAHSWQRQQCQQQYMPHDASQPDAPSPAQQELRGCTRGAAGAALHATPVPAQQQQQQQRQEQEQEQLWVGNGTRLAFRGRAKSVEQQQGQQQYMPPDASQPAAPLHAQK